MNERIKELAEQAITEKLSLDEFIAALKKEPHDFYGFRRCELEKFAELIVKECLDMIYDNNIEDGDRALGAVADMISKYFGIEE